MKSTNMSIIIIIRSQTFTRKTPSYIHTSTPDPNLQVGIERRHALKLLGMTVLAYVRGLRIP